MHEYSVMLGLVESLLDDLKDRELKRVISVELKIGELTFINPDALDFAYTALAADTILEGSVLKVEKVDAAVSCSSCGYGGPVEHTNDDHFYFNIPIITCPQCGEKPKVIKGKEVMITGVSAEVK